MRVIAGSARGRALLVPAAEATRPFLEMARGALFNMLAARLAGSRVLDLYAGSGALGIEALSRGAAEAVFVESDPRAVAALRQNLENCGFTGAARVREERVERALAGLEESFDIVLIDPPYAADALWLDRSGGEDLRRAAAARLAPGGRLALRIEAGEGSAVPEWPDLDLNRDRTHGRSRLLLFHRSG